LAALRILCVFIVSLFVEIIQGFFGIGASDILKLPFMQTELP